MTWHKFSLDLEKNSWWHLFKSDGNYIYGPETPDFDVITSIIFEVGCSLPSGPAAALAQKPGPGKGRFELRNIRLSEIEEGHSV